MKKVYLGLLLSTALLGINAANADVTLNGANVDFKGYVLQSSCKISYINTNGQTVQLPVTQPGDWTGMNVNSSKTKAFAIKLTECACDDDLKNYTEPDVFRKISWTVNNTNWEPRTGSGTLDVIHNSGSAGNVDIFLTNTDVSRNPNSAVTASNFVFKSSASDGDVYNFLAGYARNNVNQPAGAGSVSGTSAFTVLYQ